MSPPLAERTNLSHLPGTTSTVVRATVTAAVSAAPKYWISEALQMKLFRAVPVPIYRHVRVLGVGSGQWIVACGGVEIPPARPDNTEALIQQEALGR